MKKLKILALSMVALTVLFAGCKKEAEFQDVKTVKVADVAKGVKQEKKVASADEFDAIVIPAIMQDVMEFAGSFDSEGEGDYSLRAAVQKITVDQLEEAFNDLAEQFDAIDDDATTVKIDWKAPTGKLDFGEGVDGIDASIDTLAVKIDAKRAISGDAETVTGSASANAAGTASVVDLLDSIPNLKINATAGAKLKDLKVTVKETDDHGELVSISGTAAAKVGVDGAFLFVAENDGEKYNGVVKTVVSIEIDQKLSKDKFEKLQDAIEEIGKHKGQPDFTKLDEYAKIKVSIDVYDVGGKKLFNYFNANSISTFYSNLMEKASVFMSED